MPQPRRQANTKQHSQNIGGQYAPKPTPDTTDTDPVTFDDDPTEPFSDLFPLWVLEGLQDAHFWRPVGLEHGPNLWNHIDTLLQLWQLENTCWCTTTAAADPYCPECLNVELERPKPVNGLLDRAFNNSDARYVRIAEEAFKATFNAHDLDERLLNTAVINRWRRAVAHDPPTVKAEIWWLPPSDRHGYAQKQVVGETVFDEVNGVWLLSTNSIHELMPDWAGTLNTVSTQRDGGSGVWNAADGAYVRIPAEEATTACVIVTTDDFDDFDKHSTVADDGDLFGWVGVDWTVEHDDLKP